MKKALLKIIESKPYLWLMFNVLPFVRLTTGLPKFTGAQYESFARKIEVGDIVLCADRKKLTTVLIGGVFSHACICVQKNEQGIVIAGMEHEGFKLNTFFDICRESDDVAILRMNASSDYVYRFVDNVLSHRNAKYDFQFKLGLKFLYCSELVYVSDTDKILDLDLSDLKGLGQKYISPDGLAFSNTSIVATSTRQIYSLTKWWDDK